MLRDTMLRDMVTRAVEQAVHAPSLHNTQPWHWQVDEAEVRLFADPDRHLIATDPDGRDLVLSCGAALHHLLVALARQGVDVRVDRQPDPDDRIHLATVTVCSGAGPPADPALAAATDRRRTDRRRMSDRPVPSGLLRQLGEHARRSGALLFPVDARRPRAALIAALGEAARRQQQVPGYVAELEAWTHRYAGSDDGIPPTSIAVAEIGATTPASLRGFPDGRLTQPGMFAGEVPADDGAELLVVTTAGDDVGDWLRAGEAMSAVLLAATLLGLATTPLSQGVEVDATRQVIQRDVLHTPEQPQHIIRVGWPVPGAPAPPPTPRRSLQAVLLPA